MLGVCRVNEALRGDASCVLLEEATTHVWEPLLSLNFITNVSRVDLSLALSS